MGSVSIYMETISSTAFANIREDPVSLLSKDDLNTCINGRMLKLY